MKTAKHGGSEAANVVLYAMGALNGDVRREFNRRRVIDAEFDKLLASWESRLLEMALETEDLAPPEGLWDRIDAALQVEAVEPAGLKVIRFDRSAWEPWSAGLEVKILSRTPKGLPDAFLMRMQPGALIPQHFHDRLEECLIIEGDLLHAGHLLGPGDFTVGQAGGVHAAMTSPSGGLLYVRYLAA